MADDLTYLAATRLAEMLGSGQLTSVELVQSCLARTKAVDGRVRRDGGKLHLRMALRTRRGLFKGSCGKHGGTLFPSTLNI